MKTCRDSQTDPVTVRYSFLRSCLVPASVTLVPKTLRALTMSVIGFGSVFFLLGCDLLTVFDSFGICRNTITMGSTSPTDKYSATVFQRTCALKSPATFVEIRAGIDKFNGHGKGLIFAVDGAPPIGVAWQDETHLQIECIRCRADKVFKQDKGWKDVVILYKNYGEAGK